jgi:hypothetical protein
MHEGNDAAIEDEAIKARVAEQDRIAMMMLKAVHGGSPGVMG